MMNKATNLSGPWTGVYDYGAEGDDAVPFSATLTDVGGVIWGTTQEPNTFAPDAGKELCADVSGMRSGREVRFRKTYQARPKGGEHAVEYAGHVTADGNRIEGRWRILVPGATLSGPFVMNRVRGATVSVGMRAEAMVEIEL